MANTFSSGTALLFVLGSLINGNEVDGVGLDQNGNHLPLAGTSFTWTSSDPTILAPTVAADTLSATGTPLKDGTVTLTAVSGSATAAIALTITAGQLTSVQIFVHLAPPPPPPPPA